MRQLFVRKSVEDHSEDIEIGEQHPHLQRHLSAFQLVAIGIGAIIGAGIFVITGQAAAIYAGPAVVFSFFIAACICLFTGLCYGELSSFIPISGGSYTYSYVALGEFPAWIVGWTVTAQYLVVASTVAVGWSGYFQSLLEDLNVYFPISFSQAPLLYSVHNGWQLSGHYFNLPAVILVVIITFFLTLGIKSASRLNSLMVVFKLSAILLFIGFGISFIQKENWIPFIPPNEGHFGHFGISGIFRGAGIVFFAYLGFDALATLSQEAKDPQKDVPKGILGSLIVCTTAYIITSLVLTGMVNYVFLNVPDPIAAGLKVMGPKFLWLKLILQLAILAGLASVVLVQLLGQTRIFFAMSLDGLISAKFSKIHPKFQTPTFCCIMTGLFSALIAALLPLNLLGEIVSMAALFLFAIVCLGVWVLRYTHPEYDRPFKVPFVPFIPLFGILGCLFEMFFLSSVVWIELSIWTLIGISVYFFYSVRHSKMQNKQ